MTRSAVIAARACRGLAPFVVVALVSGTAAASPLDGPLRAALGEVPAPLTASIAALDARGPSLGILERKLDEGMAKGVGRERLADALARMADNLVWVEAQLVPCARANRPLELRALAELGNEVLLSGVARDALAPALSAACARADTAAWTSRTADLYFYLVHKLMADPPKAWELTLRALAAADADTGLGRFVLVLQDLQRERGSIDRPLELATSRLREGASLRRVRVELEEHFLRR